MAQVGDLYKAPVLSLAFVIIWEVKQQMEDISVSASLSLCLCNFDFQINSKS